MAGASAAGIAIGPLAADVRKRPKRRDQRAQRWISTESLSGNGFECTPSEDFGIGDRYLDRAPPHPGPPIDGKKIGLSSRDESSTGGDRI